MVTLDVMSTIVFRVASGILSTSAPRGHELLPTRNMTKAENNAPKSITSEAKKSQVPNFPLVTPVTG
jgi:hypothetical protein